MKLPTLEPEQGPADRERELAEGRWRPRRGRGFKIMAWAILALIAVGTLVMVWTIVQAAWQMIG